jgi:hypothetical protein
LILAIGLEVCIIVQDRVNSIESDPRRLEVGKIAFKVWFYAKKAMVEALFRDRFQTKQEMEEFIGKMKNEMENREYRLYTYSYEKLERSADSRYTTIGRKPDVPV